jgi:SH3 domain-containing YSC84-like protein 1
MVFNKPYSSSMEKEIQKAANIINSFFNNSTVDADSAIPAEMIKNCAGLAFLTVVKAGLVWTGKLGTGVVIARLDDGTWSAPSGIGTAGIGFGAEIGGEIIDFMIVLGSKGAVNTFKKGTQVSVGAGLELAVGPLGRAAGGNLNAGGGGLSANYTYSRAKGAFAGVGLHGSTILVRGEMNSKFYGREVTPMEILSGHVQAPPGACDRLLEAIAMAEGRQGITVVRCMSIDGGTEHAWPEGD